MSIKILLDPGHGQYDKRGYVGSKWKTEGAGNWHFSKLLEKELKAYGFQVGTTRPRISDNPSLTTRGRMGRGHDLFLSLHTNAGQGTGVEIFGDLNANSPGLMADLCSTIARVLNIRNRGNKWRRRSSSSNGQFFTQLTSPGGSNWYGVLYNNQAKVGMLIEHCFHDNKSDVEKYEARAEQLAREMAGTIAKHYGVNKVSSGGSGSAGNMSSGGDSTMLGNKPVAIISAASKGDIESGASDVIRNFLWPSYNPVIVESGFFDYGNIRSNYIIGLGGSRGSQSGYINYHVAGKNRGETLELAKEFRRNKEKFRV